MHRRRFLEVSGGALALLAGCQGDELDEPNAENSPDPTSTPDPTTPEPTATPDPSPTETATPADRPDLTAPEPSLFTGEERTLVVNGYSTSYDWPDSLQRKLDRYFDDERVVTVEKAVEPGTPIAGWMNSDTGDPKDPWRETLEPALGRDGPIVVLAQQSLQGVYGDFREGIRDEDDTERIERGADVLERYTSRLVEDGADHVFVAMHIYKEPFEPEIGNERLALDAFLDRDPSDFTAGPDVWEPTKAHWPEAFQDDELHPNRMGAEIMAHYWFRRLLVSDTRTVPDWSREEMEAVIEDES